MTRLLENKFFSWIVVNWDYDKLYPTDYLLTMDLSTTITNLLCSEKTDQPWHQPFPEKKYSALLHWVGLFRPLEDEGWFATFKGKGKQFQTLKDGNSGEEFLYVLEYQVLEKISVEKMTVKYHMVLCSNQRKHKIGRRDLHGAGNFPKNVYW